jgi:hypothetical protein
VGQWGVYCLKLKQNGWGDILWIESDEELRFTAAMPGEAFMRERMTRAEIEAKFDSEHVLLDEPDVDEHTHLSGGTVVFRSKNEEEVYRKAAELKLKRMAFLYTGEIAKDAIWIF